MTWQFAINSWEIKAPPKMLIDIDKCPRLDAFLTKLVGSRKMTAVTESIKRQGRVYVAGKMRGVPRFNFPAFFAAEAHLACMGWQVVNPARMDLEAGFDPSSNREPDPEFIRKAFGRDLYELADCDAIALLPGWETSNGATLELAVARFLGLQVIDAHSGEEIEARVNVHVPVVEDLQ